MLASLWRGGINILISLLIFGTGVIAGEDPFGEVDLVYIDSIRATAGQQLFVRVNCRNDEPLSSISIPLAYDTAMLTLEGINYTGSRIEYIDTKIVNPDKAENIKGHFVVAIIRIFEDAIPVGDGLIFTAVFTLADSLAPGTTTIIDSLFFPPGGELMLVEESQATVIYPDFQPGQITVRSPNRGPSFVGLANETVMEGEPLQINVTVSDPDDDKLTLAVTSKPTGATFTDHGDGTASFGWTPPFVGPYSSDQAPFTVSFWASDGNLSVEQTINISVINVNRRPTITVADSIIIFAGDAAAFEISAVDPDFEATEWTMTGQPANAIFDNYNPGHYYWSSTITDSGSSQVHFIATDPAGAADSATVTVTVMPAQLYSMSIDTVSSDPGTQVEIGLNLQNLLPVAGFNLLIGYDASVLTLSAVDNNATRSEQFEYFSVTPDEDGIIGHLRLLGIADQTGDNLPRLETGDGMIGRMAFNISGNLAFAGQSVAIQHRFMDPFTLEDNTLTDTSGNKIGQEQIEHIDGWVQINSVGEISVGDINLNGIPYEIGDIILFTNYIINPAQYPFTALQYANSDINGDQIVASLADLVA
ncbi:MAG: cohesin domain-containing protein, partial [candidate division Zixibacteria bacterium]